MYEDVHIANAFGKKNSLQALTKIVLMMVYHVVAKLTGKMLYDHETEFIYDKLGEKDRILTENEKLKADVQYLYERLSLKRKMIDGKVLSDKEVADTARKILNYYSKQEFAAGLKEIYGCLIELIGFCKKELLQ